MTYTVDISNEAVAQIDAAYAWLADKTAQHAPIWHNELLDALLSLEENPLRCPHVPARENPAGHLRQLLFGNSRHAYRILFLVHGRTVSIVEIVHAARHG